MTGTTPPEVPSKTFRTAVDIAPEAVTISDPDGVMVYVNHSAARILGYDDPEDLVGESWDVVYDDDEIDRLEGEIGEALARGDTWRGEAVGTTESGSKVPLDVSVRVLETGHVVGIASDVTDRKRREWELKRQNERLDEFASVVSHDLRNPLNVAQGFLDVAREERDDVHLVRVADALDRMDELIDNVLSVARQGGAVTEMVPVSLPSIVKRAWKNVETADATLVVEADSTMSADDARLLRLVENVLRNAVEHGGPDVTVRVGDLDDGFYVEDTGPGISEADRESAFDFGYSTRSGGTGFGLAIVEQIADAHGWETSITESDEGGARFEFRNACPYDVTRAAASK